MKVACMAKAGVGVGILGLGYLLDNGMNILVRQVDGRDTPEEEREPPFVVPKEMGKKEKKTNLIHYLSQKLIMKTISQKSTVQFV